MYSCSLHTKTKVARSNSNRPRRPTTTATERFSPHLPIIDLFIAKPALQNLFQPRSCLPNIPPHDAEPHQSCANAAESTASHYAAAAHAADGAVSMTGMRHHQIHATDATFANTKLAEIV
jgi:hypothetical protein